MLYQYGDSADWLIANCICFGIPFMLIAVILVSGAESLLRK